MEIIARIKNDYSEKFGIPRQSGLNDLESVIEFEEPYKNREAVRGLENFEYIWLIWEFSKVTLKDWKPTVRPPRLGGNKRIGVFATRSPFRPNKIGLSSVKLKRIDFDKTRGPLLIVQGADLLNDTPILDIKPYLPYCDSHENASAGFTEGIGERILDVSFPDDMKKELNELDLKMIREILQNDPRPSYHDDPDRIYGVFFKEFDVHFTVSENRVTVVDITKKDMHF